MIKKLLTVLAAAAMVAGAQAQTRLTVGAAVLPHAEILNFVAPSLKEQGITLEVREFTDYVLPNIALQEKQIDANYFQHIPYLENFNKERRTDIVQVPDALMHIEPFGAYSRKIKSIEELRTGAIVAIPNDATNSGRALLLLDRHGLIKLRDPENITATAADIIENPKKLQIRELEAAILPRAVNDVDMAMINANYALMSGFVPADDALLLEDADSPYVNVIATRPERIDDPAIRTLVEALHTEEVREFIRTKYKGAVVPAF